eukprot:76319_1
MIQNKSYGGNAITFLAHHSNVFHELIVNNSQFTNNDYKFSTQYGGHLWIDLDYCTNELDLYMPDDCKCIELFNDSYTINLTIVESEFFASSALFGGAIYSKLPITINADFKNTKAKKGGAIYVGCADVVTLTGCHIKDAFSLTHGGGVLLNKLQNVYIQGTVFDSCSAEFAGGGLAYIMNSDYNSNIHIGDNTQFINNNAIMGGALFSSQHRLSRITERKRIKLEPNVTGTYLADFDLDTVGIDTNFETQYVFILLEPVNNLYDLSWSEDYLWNDSVVRVTNQLSATKLTFSTVDDSRFISPLFIPLTTTKRDKDKAWRVSNTISWRIEMNFAPFWDTLMNGGNVTKLEFDVLLLSYPFIYEETSKLQNIIGRKLLLQLENGVSFDNNRASGLGAAIYVNDDLFPDFTVNMDGVVFTGNEASGLSGFAINSYAAKADQDLLKMNKKIQAVDVIFKQNTALTSSACMSVIATNLTCSGCEFSENTVATFGAALYVKNGEIHLSGNSKIIDNNSPLGGNLLLFKSKLFISNTEFDGNKAIYGNGAGISIYNLNELIYQEMIASESAVTGMFEDITTPELVSISDCTFKNHISKEDGAAVFIYLEESDPTLFLFKNKENERRRALEIESSYYHGRRRLLQSNFTNFNVTNNRTNSTNNTYPIFSTTVYKSTQMFTTINPTNEPTIEPTIIPTNEPTLEPTYKPTLEPTVDSTCVSIDIMSDFHDTEITWELNYAGDDLYGNVLDNTGFCKVQVSDNTKCITFSIYDTYDGLNYGQGTYYVSWGEHKRQSISFGNYFNNEKLKFCNPQYILQKNLDIYVSMQEQLSYQFLDFLNDIINPLMDDMLTFNLIFTDIQHINQTVCSVNECIGDYCVCAVEGNNNTASNIAMALCYASNETLREIYDVEWQQFWDDDVDYITMDALENECNAELLLSINYKAIQQITTNIPIPTFDTIISTSANKTDISIYENLIIDILLSGNNISPCKLYRMFPDIIEPICNMYTSNEWPYLCNVVKSGYGCSEQFYCSVDDPQTKLIYEYINSDVTLRREIEFTPYKFIDTVGSQYVNIPPLSSTLYGIEEYQNIIADQIECLTIQNISISEITNTIPIIAAVFDVCDYSDLFLELQNYGARAIVVATFIDENTPAPTAAPTKSPFISPLNYDYWRPFVCDIQYHSWKMNYTLFTNLAENLTTYLSNTLETNFKNVLYELSSIGNIIYAFEANTTIERLDERRYDQIVATLIKNNFFMPPKALNAVKCMRLPRYNESYSNAPTPEPTSYPTTQPTKRAPIYDNIYIPIEIVSLARAQQLILDARTSTSLTISLTCDTQAPTSAPSKAPTVHVNETRPDDTTKTDSQLVIFGYESDASASVALTFPEIDFLTFREVYQDTCNWELDVLSSEDYELYLVSVDTIYTSIDEICIRFNNKDIVLQPDKSELSNNSVGLYEWTAEESSDTAPSCSEDKYRMSIKGIDRGSYCFAAYQLKGSAGVVGLDETKYKFRLQKRFIWTDTFVHILNTNFENNIATHGAGGAIAIVSEDGIDEFFSAQISYSNFTENYAMLGGGAIYREYSYAEIANYRSAYMSVLELTSVNINESVVVINEGGSIKTDLASKVKSQGLYFKYVLSITDSIIGHSTTAGDEINTKEIELLRRRNRIRRRRMQSNVDENPGDPDDGYGGVLHFEYSNVYLAYSIIEFGKAYQGGGIYLFDTVFQSFHSDILDNKASSDGGGLYQSLYSKYSKYDLCVSIYQTFFDNNIAGRFGGAIYSKLHGKEIGNTRVENRESCFKIINGTFINNGNISVYVNVTSGQHKVLRNQGALSTFCPDTSECTDFKSVLQYLCVTQIPEHCEKDFNPTDDDSINPLTVIKDIPGASVILYIYGWDAFGNRMLNTEFGLLASASGAQVINPGGTQSTANKNQYIVPLVVSTGSKDTFAQIIVEDIGGRADPIKITLQITDCDPGFHQNKITKDSDLFECNYCPVDKYTMGTSPCKNCPNGMECSGGNNVYVKENWYGKVGVGTCWTSNTENCAGKVEPGTCWADDNYDPDNSYITTTLCPPGYCCSVAKCTFPTLFNYTWDDDQNDPNFYKCYNESNTDNNNSTRRRRFAEDIDTDTDTDTDTNNDTHDIKHKKNTKSHNGKYKCKICEKTFSASYFKIHQRVHTKEKPFQCNQCSKAFRQKCHLNNHITQIHAKNGKYLCKYCSKRFCKPSQLKRHTRTHTNERPFKCDKCNKAFALKCNLKHHTRTHTKEKPFKCSQCNRAFALKCNLKRHKKRHQKKHKR